jgi:hypothetical protein
MAGQLAVASNAAYFYGEILHAGNPMPEATKATPVKQNVDSVRSFQQFSAALRSSPIAVVPSP